MSTPVTYTWGDVVTKLLDGLKAFIYQIGDFIATNAKAIAEAALGIGLAVGIGYAVYRFIVPSVRRLLRLF